MVTMREQLHISCSYVVNDFHWIDFRIDFPMLSLVTFREENIVGQ